MPTSEIPPIPYDEAANAARHIVRLHEVGRTASPQAFHEVLDALARCDPTIAGWRTRDTNRQTKRAITTIMFLLGLLLIVNGPVELLVHPWSALGIGLLAAPGMFSLELRWLSKRRSDDRPALRIAVGAVLELREPPESQPSAPTTT